jgi:hypothetical protein
MRLGKWIYPIAEHILLRAFTLEHAQEIMRRIPTTKARATRRSVAQLVARVVNLALYPCKYLEHSPIPRGLLPRTGNGKALTYLYPDEDRRLLACDAVPYSERLLFGVRARRAAMRGGVVDPMASPRPRARLDPCRLQKTDGPRTWALDLGVAR